MIFAAKPRNIYGAGVSIGGALRWGPTTILMIILQAQYDTARYFLPYVGESVMITGISFANAQLSIPRSIAFSSSQLAVLKDSVCALLTR